MKVEITGEFIKLGQLLKKINIIDTGGGAKYFVSTHEIIMNNKKDLKRSSKIWVGSTVWIDDKVYYIVKKNKDESL